MSELITNRLWETGNEDGPSPYARMIPGTPATSRPRVARATQTPIWLPGPEGTANRSTIRPLATAAFLVLAGGCVAASYLFSSRRAPGAYVPVFAVLVTAFGFFEGISITAKIPFHAGNVAAQARSMAFEIGLFLICIFIFAWAQMGAGAGFAVFTSGLTGLILWQGLRPFSRKRRQNESELPKVLIVGGGPLARSIASTLRHDPVQRATVCGFVDDELPLSPAVLGRIADLDWLARAEFIDEVILALPGQPGQMREAAEVAYRNHLDIRAVPDLPPGPWSDGSMEHIGEIPVVTLHREPLPGTALFLKRFIDVAGAGLGLALIGPLMALVAVLIRLDSPGPVIYSAERTGAKGRRFCCHKFRSMVTNAEHLKEELRDLNQRQGPIFKIDNDPRVTRIGRIIRRYSLDELPQLWNVLRGEMSLVGPRPHPVDEVNHYELQHYRRLDVKPGITGLWQITARDCPSFELNMHLDLTYIENWSLALDLRILASTLRVLFMPEGA